MTEAFRGPKKPLVADWESLMRTFIRPEDEAARSTLLKYMEQILFGLHDFLRTHVGITREISLRDLAEKFVDTRISPQPEKRLAEVITDLIEEIAPRGVNVASPYFVGHMTSAIPFFMVHLKSIVAALNQNVVKLETSKVFSMIEKQVLAKIHRMVFNFDNEFYRTHVQHPRTALGTFTEDGTLANYTALWVARNSLLGPKPGFGGVESEGLAAAFGAHGVARAVILVSGLGHYSLKKAAGLLGVGNENVISVPIDSRQRMDPDGLDRMVRDLGSGKGDTAILAVVGVAGTTETGSVDPLRRIGEVCRHHSLFFHVDAAWGGPTLLSERYRGCLDGIDAADSVTIDGHKQFYMPMTCGMVLFKNPESLNVAEYHSNYVIREGSVDLGIKSISGSREASSLILDSALKIMGGKGYALMIDHGIETAAAFAEEIERRPDFELVTRPELNILTYRFFPRELRRLSDTGSPEEKKKVNDRLNEINRKIQRLQREAGSSFVSRTTLYLPGRPGGTVVLRCVIMNPMTTPEILSEILDEQEAIYRHNFKNRG